MTARKKEKLSPEVLKLASHIGKFMEYWGFKSIHGRIWAVLFLAENPLSSVEISRKLKVSKTLLSFSVAQLLEYEVIQEAGKGVKRTVYFRANPNVTAVILNVLKKRERPLMKEIQTSFRSLKKAGEQTKDFQINPEQLQRMGELISAADASLNALISHTQPGSDLVQQFFLIAAALSTENPKNS